MGRAGGGYCCRAGPWAGRRDCCDEILVLLRTPFSFISFFFVSFHCSFPLQDYGVGRLPDGRRAREPEAEPVLLTGRVPPSRAPLCRGADTNLLHKLLLRLLQICTVPVSYCSSLDRGFLSPMTLFRPGKQCPRPRARRHCAGRGYNAGRTLPALTLSNMGGP